MTSLIKTCRGSGLILAAAILGRTAAAAPGAADDAAFSSQISSLQKAIQAPPASISAAPRGVRAKKSPSPTSARFALTYDATFSRYVCEDKNFKKGRNRSTLAAVEEGSSGECVDFHKDPSLAIKNDGRLGGDGYMMAMGHLSGANLRGADFRNFSLNGSDFSGADLRGADLRHTDLTGVNLAGANLNGANMSGAKIDATKLDGASYNDDTKLPWSALANHRAAKAGMKKTIGR